MFGIGEKQLEWLSRVLKITKEDWSVLFMSHNFLMDNGFGRELVKNGDLAWEIISGYKNHKKGTVKSKEKYFKAEVSYDFTDNKSNDVLLYLYGHLHKDTQIEKDGIVAVSSKRLLGKLDMEWDNMSETVDGGWNCVHIDKEKRHIKIKRYGDGAEKVINI